MIRLFVAISALLLAVAALNVGMGLQATLLGVRSGVEHFSVTVTGLVMAAYYAGFVAGAVYCRRLIRQFGHIRAFAALASIVSAAALLHAVYVSPGAWIALRLVSGLCYVGLVMVAESWLNQAATNEDRGRVLSMYMVTAYSATGLGQLLLGAAPVAGFELFVLVSVVTSLALVPVALTTGPAPIMTDVSPAPVLSLFRNTPVGVVGSLSTGLVNGALWGMGAVFASRIGMATWQISLFMLAVVAGGIVAQWPAGWLSDRIDRRLVIAGLCTAAAATGALVAALDPAVHQAHFWAAAIFGAVALPLYSVSIAHTNDMLEPGQFVPASGAMLLIYGVGATIGPVAGGLAMAAVGPRGLFVYIAVVAALTAAFALVRTRQRAALASEDKTDFVAVPATSGVAIDLDPRTDLAAAAADPFETIGDAGQNRQETL